MIQYATTAELAAYIDPDNITPVVPPLATVLLRAASQLVLDAIAAARYVAIADIPTDVDVLAAVKNATMEQAAAWSLHSIDPRKGASQVARRVQSKSVTGVSVSYVADRSADTELSTLAAAEELTSAALRFLSNAGLLSNRVDTGASGGEYFNVTQRYYDPLTGSI